MIKIKLHELEIHRNECTFRPYLQAQNSLREIGIEFTTGDSYDYAWIGQASITNKTVSLQESIEQGLEFLSNITGDYMIVDGQDSASLIGVYDVFKESSALLLLKNSLYSDINDYRIPSSNGRIYWGTGDLNYSINDLDKYIDKIKLSGVNWLSTVNINTWEPIPLDKLYDVAALFSYPHTADFYEYKSHQRIYYDRHRKLCVDEVNKLNCKVIKLKKGERIPFFEYQNNMRNSKIIIAPFGCGEMAPRDIEVAQVGSILLKPLMDYLTTQPNIFVNGETYIACNHDYSDLMDKVEYILSNYKELSSYLIPNIRKKIIESLNPNNVAIHLHKIISTLKNVEVE